MPTPVEYLRLKNRTYNALLKNGIDFVEKLAKFSLLSLSGLQGIGRLGVKEIVSGMERLGYETKLKKNGWGFSKLVPKNEKDCASGVCSGMCDERSKTGKDCS